jgi:hypothetical protein
MRLIISQDNQVVAVIEGYEGPVPRAGEFIHRPAGREPVPGLSDGFMSVKVVQYGIIARPRNGENYFTGAAEPFAEVIV